MRIFVISCLFLGFSLNLVAQEAFNSEAEYLKEYERNIKMTHLEGVYIPASIEEALSELENLSDEASLKKFAQAPIDQVAEKLHFGIGRWMIVNWQFYTGSRISHILKQKGVLTPDSMAQYLIRKFHAYLNKEELDEKELIKKVNERHEAEMKKRREESQILKTETRKIPNEGKN